MNFSQSDSAQPHTYIAIDLKSFYASVECRQRQLDPLTTHLVVADESRTEKTICLAVSPSLKALGIPGRPRLFEVKQKIEEINALRLSRAPGHRFTGSSVDQQALARDPRLSLSFIAAPPQMARYIQCSTQIYQIYLQYIAPEDIHVYSIDEVFIDATHYFRSYGLTASQLTKRMIEHVFRETGITATAGIGTNLYLCKIAMDILAKHIPPDENGVRIAELDEQRYRQFLWSHRPLTDFWRIGRGYAKKLESCGLYTMGDIARCSLGEPDDFYNEELLYKLFGVNAELLIDHAWGIEPCTMADIKAYQPQSNSIGSGQVLSCPYAADKARLVMREMADLLALDLVDKRLVTTQIVMTVGYDRMSLEDPVIRKSYTGPVSTDHFGRPTPKHAHGTQKLARPTASSHLLTEAAMALYDRIVNRDLLVRRLYLTADHVVSEQACASAAAEGEQLDFFTDMQQKQKQQAADDAALAQEKQMQQAILSIKRKFGKNALLKGMNLEDGATTISRNGQIGGHRA